MSLARGSDSSGAQRTADGNCSEKKCRRSVPPTHAVVLDGGTYPPSPHTIGDDRRHPVTRAPAALQRCFEFQMLYGIRRDLQRHWRPTAASCGSHPVRTVVPVFHAAPGETSHPVLCPRIGERWCPQTSQYYPAGGSDLGTDEHCRSHFRQALRVPSLVTCLMDKYSRERKAPHFESLIHTVAIAYKPHPMRGICLELSGSQSGLAGNRTDANRRHTVGVLGKGFRGNGYG